jgi:hypothetical protein
LPLLNQTLLLSISIFWTVAALLAIIFQGSLAEGLLLFIYEYWALKSGFRAWSVLAWSEEMFRLPPGVNYGGGSCSVI